MIIEKIDDRSPCTGYDFHIIDPDKEPGCANLPSDHEAKRYSLAVEMLYRHHLPDVFRKVRARFPESGIRIYCPAYSAWAAAVQSLRKAAEKTFAITPGPTEGPDRHMPENDTQPMQARHTGPRDYRLHYERVGCLASLGYTYDPKTCIYCGHGYSFPSPAALDGLTDAEWEKMLAAAQAQVSRSARRKIELPWTPHVYSFKAYYGDPEEGGFHTVEKITAGNDAAALAQMAPWLSCGCHTIELTGKNPVTASPADCPEEEEEEEE